MLQERDKLHSRPDRLAIF